MPLASRIAVIDLGSNTFHLLISEYNPETKAFTEVFRKRCFVYLAKEGLNFIGPDSFNAGIQALVDLKEYIKEYKVNKVIAVGTAALRTAKNSQAFISEVKLKTGINVEVISGKSEAEYIFKGLSLSKLPSGRKGVMMDIGGGSVEFIFYRNGEIENTASINVGISHLRSLYNYDSNYTITEKEEVSKFLQTELTDVLEYSTDFQPQILVGSSGSYEIIESMLQQKPRAEGNTFSRITTLEICTKILALDLSERKALKGMPEARADLSKESMLLIDFIIKAIPSIKTLLVSPYSMKEGITVDSLNLD